MHVHSAVVITFVDSGTSHREAAVIRGAGIAGDCSAQQLSSGQREIGGSGVLIKGPIVVDEFVAIKIKLSHIDIVASKELEERCLGTMEPLKLANMREVEKVPFGAKTS